MAPDRPGTLMSVNGVAPATAQGTAAAGGSPDGRGWTVPGWPPAAASAVACLLLGAYRLGVPSLWRDEAATIDAVTRPLPRIFALLHHVDAVNGAYYLCLRLVVLASGTSAVALRFPSVVAMAVAAGFTAAAGRRLAVLARLPAPAVTGLLAGLLFAAAPQVTRYAQEARPYGIVTMLAAIASYLLIRGLADDRWRWWAGYGAAVALAGLFNVFALLLLPAHGFSLLLARTRGAGEPADAVSARQLARWAAAAAAATAALSPLLVLGYLQRAQIAWLTRPGTRMIMETVTRLAGSRALLLPVAAIAACGLLAGLIPRSGHPLTPGVLALPWLAVPALILVSASQFEPLFTPRYVLYSQPALALLCAAGLSWLAGLLALALAPLGDIAKPVVWLPPALILVLLAAALAGPQRAIRLPYSGAGLFTRSDNLRHAAAVIAARERPGDDVLYLPGGRRPMSLAYPGPYRRLDDIALARSPVASATLSGTEAGPAALARRWAGVRRVWLVTVPRQHHLPPPQSRTDREKLTLLGRMRLAGHWRAGSVLLCLYVRAPPL